ncbi:MAG: thiamine pyrophosphate-dependent enzyme [Paracoccaceae bacterium]
MAPGTVDLTEALIRIDRAVPANRVFVTDGGRFMGAAWTRIAVERPEDIVLTVSAGSIGMGMGHAIGAAVARPGQPTLLVTGDGGFMLQGLTELPTAVREALDLIVVICNDQAYGAEYVQMTDRQMDPAISTFNWPPLAEAARALGCEAVRVTGPEGLEAAEAAIAMRTRPLVIELMLDAAQVPRLQL